MEKEHALECINLVAIFKGLPKAQREQLADLVIQKYYPAHSTIYSAGDKLGHFVIVQNGQIKLSAYTAEGKEQILKVLLPGEFDGETSLFSGNARNATAAALTDVNVCQIDQGAFQNLLANSPELAANMLKTMSSRIIDLEQEKTLTNTTSVKGRLAHYLLETAASEKQSHFVLPMKKKEIATYLGTTPETVSRVLKQFEKTGLIEVDKAKVTILDDDELAMIV
nr:Crp/Fnr family transcriptional regulator [Lentilactobacillus sp. Marseille-Q4993]